MWLFLVGPVRPSLPWVSGARLNSDRHPWIELLSPVSHAAGRPDDGMTPFLEQVAHEQLEGSPLSGLDGSHRAWRETGAALARASGDRDAEADQRTLAILRTLPAELQRALSVPERR